MNKYETVLIVKPELTEEEMTNLMKKYSDLIATEGTVESCVNQGLKKLAYQIAKKDNGYFVEINYEANPNLMTELTRVQRIDDNLLKFININKES